MSRRQKMYQEQRAPHCVLHTDNALNVAAPPTLFEKSLPLIRWLLYFSSTFRHKLHGGAAVEYLSKTKATPIHLVSEIALSNFRKPLFYLSLRNEPNLTLPQAPSLLTTYRWQFNVPKSYTCLFLLLDETLSTVLRMALPALGSL